MGEAINNDGDHKGRIGCAAVCGKQGCTTIQDRHRDGEMGE